MLQAINIHLLSYALFIDFLYYQYSHETELMKDSDRQMEC